MVGTEKLVTDRIAVYQASKRKGVEFLLSLINEDGSIGPVGEHIGYYRVPWAFAVSGETGAALRVLTWISRHMLTPEGEFAGAATPNAGYNEACNTYLETILAYGAQLLRQYEVAQPAMRWALRFQDPATGGVYMDCRQTGPDGSQMVFPTAQFGMSALFTGYPDAALGAGRYFQFLWKGQPELPDRLYTILTRAGGVVTQPPEGANVRAYINEGQEARQYHYNGGIAAGFLCRLYMATGDPQWLELARGYERFSMESTPRQFEVRQVCKSGWGSSLLYIITGEQQYLDWTIRMGDWFVDGQEADGHWRNSEYLDPNPTVSSKIEITAEFVVHLDHIVAALGAGMAR